MQGAPKAEKVFQPGEVVKDSGIYTVLHDGHRESHSATIFEGDRFPSCAHCGHAVRFMLVRPAALIFDDTDFKQHSVAGEENPA